MIPAPSPTLRRRQTICGAVLIVQVVYRLVLEFATPSLIGRDPVLLELLRGSTSSLIAGGAFARVGQAWLPWALVAPLPTLMMMDPFVWWAGRLWGPGLVDLAFGPGASARRSTQRGLRWFARARGPAVVFAPILPVPSPLIYAAAGWTGMTLWRFLALDLIGTLLWVGLIVGLGYALGHPAVHVAHAITHDALYITIGLVVASVAVAIWRAPRTSPPRDPGRPSGE